MRMCDLSPGVISWGSESVVVQYVDNTIKERPKRRRYFIDFNMIVKSSSGSKIKYLIEIKPKCQTIPPNPPKPVNGVISERAKASYSLAMQTYNRNILKWTAANRAAKSKGYIFKVLTEEHLFKR